MAAQYLQMYCEPTSTGTSRRLRSAHSGRLHDCSTHQNKLRRPQLRCPRTSGVEQSSCWTACTRHHAGDVQKQTWHIPVPAHLQLLPDLALYKCTTTTTTTNNNNNNNNNIFCPFAAAYNHHGWSHVDQSFLHQWTCDGYYRQMCSVPLRFKSLAMPRNGWRCAYDHFRSVVLAKILYASPAGGFTNSSDKQRSWTIYSSLRPSQFLSPRRFHCGSACCRSGCRLCLLLFYRTINTFFVVFCLNAILTRTVQA